MKDQNLPQIAKASRVQGNKLIFRNANTNDAAFILSLRTDISNSRYLSKILSELKRQITWLENYATQTGQAYFIIESLSSVPLGTVRFYDARGISFCWGSWILKDGAPRTAAIESALMVYAYGIDFLGFSTSYFNVRKGNKSVWRFHERFGATRVGQTKQDYLYEINNKKISLARQRYKKYLPQKLIIEHENGHQ